MKTQQDSKNMRSKTALFQVFDGMCMFTTRRKAVSAAGVKQGYSRSCREPFFFCKKNRKRNSLDAAIHPMSERRAARAKLLLLTSQAAETQ